MPLPKGLCNSSQTCDAFLTRRTKVLISIGHVRLLTLFAKISCLNLMVEL